MSAFALQAEVEFSVRPNGSIWLARALPLTRTSSASQIVWRREEVAVRAFGGDHTEAVDAAAGRALSAFNAGSGEAGQVFHLKADRYSI